MQAVAAKRTISTLPLTVLLLRDVDPEFVNRVDEVIVFNSLSARDFASIVRIMLGDLAKVLLDRNILFTYTDAASTLIAEESYSVKYGARNMRRYIQRHVEDKIAEAIVSDVSAQLSKIHLCVKDGKLSVECK